MEMNHSLANTRAVITGLGPIAPNGLGKKMFWEALEKGVSGINEISRFPINGHSFKLAGEVKNFDATKYLDKKSILRTDRATHLAVAAIKLALEDAHLDLSTIPPEEIDLIVGSALGGMEKYSANFLQFISSNKKRVSAYAAVSSFADSCSGSLASFFNIKGFVVTINLACASGLQAIIEACRRIRLENSKLVIACGTDAPILEEIMFAFQATNALSRRYSNTPSPFSKNRDGLILSEGAGALIIESLEHALSRNAHIYAEISGYANTTDAALIASGDETGSGKILTIEKVLKEANLLPEAVEYINAHAPGTKKGDAIEAHAIRSVFREDVPVSATKSMIGHTQGACGSLETIAALLAIDCGIIHPTINYEKSSDCNINCITQAISKKVNIVLKQSFGFGGKNAAIILKRFQAV